MTLPAKIAQLRVPIVLKLSLLTIGFLMLVSIAILYKASSIMHTSSQLREEETSLDHVHAKAQEVEYTIGGVLDKIQRYAQTVYQKANPHLSAQQIAMHLEKDLVSLEIWTLSGGQPVMWSRQVNDEYLKSYGLDQNYISYLRRLKKFPLIESFAGNIEFRNSSLPKGAPLVTISLPFVKNANGQVSHVAVADFRLELIQSMVNQVSARTTYMVDRDGGLVAHPDETLLFDQASFRSREIVSQSLKSKLKQGQVHFDDPVQQKAYMGSYTKTKYGVTVISEVAEDVLMEPIHLVKRETIYIAGTLLSITLFFVLFFAVKLTRPIEELSKLTHKIAAGNFEVEARIDTRDELRDLAVSFNSMVEGLKEREKVKSILGKFHGSTVAAKLISENSSGLSGARKEVTVFFSDLRGFTHFSENRSPEDVVSMLNEYFQLMVGIINKHGGIVDKFVGDAIMAVWGSIETDQRDPHNALYACLEMRRTLNELNEKRIQRGDPPLLMGMGINSGNVIAGTIGSDERMEFTIIGDAVNTCARIESATKAFGTDLLVSENSAKLVGDEFIFEEAGHMEAKGKAQPQKVLKVLGHRDTQGQEVLLKTPYSVYTKDLSSEKVKASA